MLLGGTAAGARVAWQVTLPVQAYRVQNCAVSKHPEPGSWRCNGEQLTWPAAGGPVVVLARDQPLVNREVEVHIQAAVGCLVSDSPIPHLRHQQGLVMPGRRLTAGTRSAACNGCRRLRVPLCDNDEANRMAQQTVGRVRMLGVPRRGCHGRCHAPPGSAAHSRCPQTAESWRSGTARRCCRPQTSPCSE